jgi:hypothetical protein
VSGLLLLLTILIPALGTAIQPSDTSDHLLDIFQSGDEGYACYRGPLLFRLPNGDVALYAAGGFNNCADQGEHTDLVFKVSKDNGRTFGKLRVLYSESTNTTKVTISNPSPVVVDGKVLMICIRNAQRLLRLRSSDSGGLIWPTTADDITEATFGKVNTRMDCLPGAMRAGGDLRQANMTVADAKNGALEILNVLDSQQGQIPTPPALPRLLQSKCFTSTLTSWTTWSKPAPPGTLLATGPPGGMILAPSSAYPAGRIIVEYYKMGGVHGSSAGVLISDDSGKTFRPSISSLERGGEGTVALAPNGSLIFNSRAPNGGRYQSESRSGGDTWSEPRLFQTGFGSNCEGAMIRLNSSDLMLFSHGGQVNGSGGRWNMTVWASRDSAATWEAAVQCEPDATTALHQAYSDMLQLSETEVLVVWERGPLGGNCKGYPAPHCFQPAGEYQTLRGRIVSFPPAPIGKR